MVCPFCGSIKTVVRNSRHTNRKNQVWRRRYCEECRRTFTTREKVELEFLEVLNEDGSTGPFLRSRLITSVISACDHMEDNIEKAFSLVETIEKNLLEGLKPQSSTITDSEIINATANVLKRFDPMSHLKYLAHRGRTLDKKAVREALKSGN